MSDFPSQETVNAFVIAAHHDLPKVQGMLTAQPGLLNETAEWFEMPIQAAAHTGQREIAQYLLDQGAVLDICTASMMGFEDDVTAILAEDPEASQALGAHEIPLMFFPAIGNNISIAEKLLAAGADVNAGEGGNTALHGAVGSGHLEMVRWLLAHDANPYARDYNGKLPIDLAESENFTEITELLRPYMKTE